MYDKATDEVILNGEELKTFLIKFCNKTSMPTRTTSIQQSIRSPSSRNQTRKSNKRYPKWKGRGKIFIISRWHDTIYKQLERFQEMILHMDITRWSIFFAAQDGRSSIQSVKIRLGADCGSDHELLIAKFRLKLKKVGKTTKSGMT